jgi:hypothetical protein
VLLSAALLLSAGAALPAQGAPAQGAPAQGTPSQAVPSRELGRAWLRELLDLDVAGAAAAYGNISRDGLAPSSDRQIAAARAVELRRIGVGTELPPPDLSALHEAMRERLLHALEQPPPQVFVDALRKASAGHSSLQEVAAQTDQLPQLRPFVAQLTDRGDRRGQRRPPPRTDDTAAPRQSDLAIAMQVLRMELEHRGPEASQTRLQWFQRFKPEPWPEDPKPALARARANLEQWLQDRDLKPEDRELLRRLATELAGAPNPAAATQLLDRLPYVAERLRKDGPR